MEGRCLAQPAPRRPLLAGLQPRPEGVSELGQWVVPRLRLLKPRAQGRGRAGQEPAHRLGAVAGSVIPHPAPPAPPSPLMTVCVCPVGTRPSEGLWARSGKPYPRPLQPCLLVLSPPARCLLGIGSLRGGGPPPQGALGGPTSRSVIVPFFLGCGSFLGPLPLAHPPLLPALSHPHPSSWVRSVRALGNGLYLQTPCFSHLPPNPQLTLVPGRMKAPTSTTQHGSEG